MIWLALIWVAIAAAATNTSLAQQHDSSSGVFEYRGVALGGWLVLEPYITPSLFRAFHESGGSDADIPVDEYHFCKQLGSQEASRRLERHWRSFYNESDFAQIRSYGLNMVRIPVGYWAFARMPGDPYVAGAQEYLDQAIEWSHRHDLKVWVDLHGVPGSQNGFDNSGLRDIGYPGWLNHTANVELSAKVLEQIFRKYGNVSNAVYAETVIGIEIVNEPLGPKLNMSEVAQFYRDSYDSARRWQSVNNTIVLHDAFEPMGYWNHWHNASDNVLVDHHHYEVFAAGALDQSMAQHIASIKAYSAAIAAEEAGHPSVVGEWSAALTDCTPWLNGVGLGARYEGQPPYDNARIGSCAHWSRWTKRQRADTRKFVEIQLEQYANSTCGWIFWCYKTEDAVEWDFRRLVELGMMPQPLSDRKYIVNGTDTSGAASVRANLAVAVVAAAAAAAAVAW
ncbi:glucan 1,3-beta-glucosidase [[Candida] zeylanoides]